MAHGLVSQAQTPPDTNAPVRLPEMVVTGEAEYNETIQGPFLPPVQGTKINAGKKTAVLDLDELPRINNNNYRQALIKTPGLLLSEETSPLVSIGYRGLNPHRSQFTQVLKDGIPIHADQFGYPEAYYTPPLDTVDRIEFVHGGASLQYGPQPGGALNYITHRPRTDKEFSARTQHVFGSDNLYSTFNSVDGTIDRVGYYAYFNHRQSDGFRQINSDYDLFTGSAKLVLDATSDSRWLFNFDGYQEEHGEPGGLTRSDFDANPEKTTHPFDRFQLERYVGSLSWERDFSENTFFTANAWGGYYSRYSKRQRTSNPDQFGTIPDLNSNTIELQEFYTQGLEARLRHDWHLGENTHTLAFGAQLYHTDSPRVDERGSSATADRGALRAKSQREVFSAPVFVENRFSFGQFSITPGLRVENFVQSVEEKVNVSKTTVPLGDKDEHSIVPLAGLALEYEVRPNISAYGNASQSYRPPIFTEAVPTSAAGVVNSDLEEGKSWLFEVGFRGQPLNAPYLTFDTSLFWLNFEDQIGTVAGAIVNTGHSRHRGAEAALEVELLGLANALRGDTLTKQAHRFSLFGNAMVLEAEYLGSMVPGVDGKTPQYAPDYIVRTGAIYRWRDKLKLAFTGTFVDEHYANDTNTERFRIPSYDLWDLTLEWKVYKNNVSILAGVNNLFDEDYYSRVRTDGIDPAYGRNFYAGVAFSY